MVKRAIEQLRGGMTGRGVFFRGVVTLLSGTLASRVIAVLAIPVLARLYTPAEFGLLALFTTLAGIVTAVACGRYEMAVVLPDDDSDSLHLLIASLLIATAVSALAAVGFWLYGGQLAALLAAPELEAWLWINPLVIWSICAFNALRSWASRRGEFGGISRAVVGNTLLTALTQFLVAYPQRWLAGGLIVGRVVGQLAQALMLLASSWGGLREVCASGVSWSRMRALLYRYRDFPLFDAGANLLNQSSRELPVLLLGVFFSPVIVGFYSVGRRMLGMPVALVSNAMAQAFFPKANEEFAKGTLDRLAGDVFERLVIVGMTPMLMVALVTPEIVSVFLGDKWLESIIYVRWLSVWVLVIFITAPFAQLFNVLEKQRERLLYTAALMLAQASALVWGGQQSDPVLAVAVFSVVSAVGTLANYLWLLSHAGVPVGASLRILLVQAVQAAPFLVVLYLAAEWLDGELLVLAATAAVAAVFAVLRLRRVLGRARAPAAG